MLVRNRESLIEVLCPAKLNLYLEVKGKRADGYHEIETVMQTVSIYDRLVLEPATSAAWAAARPAASGMCLVCDDPSIPSGADNTVCRAVEEMRRATGVGAGVRIHLEKKIPAGAGLAGGSSDAAGAIIGLDLLWQTGLPRASLTRVAAAVGSDVPFFLTGGTAVCRGRGEDVTALPAAGRHHFVVVWPGLEVLTHEVYRRLDLILTDHAEHGSMVTLAQLLGRSEPERTASITAIAEHFFNRLEKTALGVCADLVKVKRAMAEEGLLGVTMTGSGSAFFGLCEGKEVAAQKKRKLAASGIGLVFACESTEG